MYACKSCGAGLRYDIATDKLICDYCGSTYDMKDFDELNGSQAEFYFEATRFRCTQCGAELVSADNTGATFCSFCGSSTLLESRLSKEKKPDFIIPFSKTKKDCADSYVKMMKKSLFAPNELKDPSYIDGFRGIYMPYWIYDAAQSSDFKLKGEKKYTRGDYYITDHYELNGHVEAEYFGISHDASYEFSDDISEAIAPYDVRETKDFHGSYLSGFYADISDVPETLYSQDALQYATSATAASIRSCKDFSSYQVSGQPVIAPTLNKTKYALLPVWFMSYKNNDRIAYVTINGQTGKIAADIPVDIKKYIKYSLLLAIPIFILLNLMNSITAPTMLTVCIFLSLFALGVSISEASKIMKKDMGLTDKGLQSIQKDKPKKFSVFASMKERLFVKKELFGLLLTFVSLIICLTIKIIDPISDLIYYSGAIVSLISTCLGMIDVMKDHNVLVTRKLPQFNREGGNDSANFN